MNIQQFTNKRDILIDVLSKIPVINSDETLIRNITIIATEVIFEALIDIKRIADAMEKS